MGHRVIPIDRVGCYVPGGRFPLLSAPIMTIVPAKVAGVPEVIACLPPNAHEAMVAGCHLSGADRIFRIGGAQAIAAMAFGTETVPGVMKIMGPGNAFVNEAKRQVFGPVGIDQLAGPSEIYILADETGDAEMIATDLLAQAEHDVRTRVGLITTHRPLAEAVVAEVERQMKTLSTAHVAEPAWRDYGEIAVCEDEAAMIAYSDFIAAEHLAGAYRAMRMALPKSCATMGRCSSANWPAWSIPTNARAPTTRCRRWRRGAIPAGFGWGPMSRSPRINGWSRMAWIRLHRPPRGRRRVRGWRAIVGRRNCVWTGCSGVNFCPRGDRLVLFLKIMRQKPQYVVVFDVFSNLGVSIF